MITTFRTLDKNGTHIDTSKTLRGAKNYATRNGYTIVSKQTGYNAFVVAKKINNKWIDRDLFLDYLQSHVELEHILIDCKDRHNTDDLTILDYDSLVDLAIDYDF